MIQPRIFQSSLHKIELHISEISLLQSPLRKRVLLAMSKSSKQTLAPSEKNTKELPLTSPLESNQNSSTKKLSDKKITVNKKRNSLWIKQIRHYVFVTFKRFVNLLR
jgi:hypothetical protein